LARTLVVACIAALLIAGCATNYSVQERQAKDECDRHGQKFYSLGIDNNAFTAICYQENPMQVFKWLLKTS